MKFTLTTPSVILLSICMMIGSYHVAYANVGSQSNDKVYDTVDKVPVFKRNRGNVQKYLSKNLNYPIEALAKEIEGKVLVTFVVTKEGKLLNPQVEKGLNEMLDKEAVRVVSTMYSWKPGEVKKQKVDTKVTIPVHFYLSEGNKELAKQLKPFYVDNKPPLFVLDKKKVEGLATLDYYNVKSIRVIKGQKAIDLYGEAAKNGVLVVETKRGTEPIYKR